MRHFHLTPKQRARIPEFVAKWTAIGLATAPIDRERAERALCRLYSAAGLAEPRIIWVPCPLSGMLSALAFAAIRGTGHESALRSDKTRIAFVDGFLHAALSRVVPEGIHRALGLAVAEALDRALRPPARPERGIEAAVAIAKVHHLGSETSFGKWLDPWFEKRLGELILDPIRATVGATLGPVLEGSLNSVAQRLLDPEIRLSGWAYFGAPLWVPFAAKLDFLTQILGVPLGRGFVETARYCGLYWVLDGLCFAAERPSHINRDAGGNLHCEVGPALAYPSGWGFWHWHGLAVPQHIVEEPHRITVEAIERTRPSPLRRVMIERYRHGHEIHGVAAFLRDKGGVRLDHDETFGTLWRCEMPEEEPIVMVEVVNHSPQPDGSYKRYFLRVHPELRPLLAHGGLGRPQPLTAHNAVASTFGLCGIDYAPDVET